MFFTLTVSFLKWKCSGNKSDILHLHWNQLALVNPSICCHNFLVYQRTKHLVLIVISSFQKTVYLVMGVPSAELSGRNNSLWETQRQHSAFDHKDPLVFGHPQQIHIKWMFTFRNPRCHFITAELTSRIKRFLLLRIHPLKKRQSCKRIIHYFSEEKCCRLQMENCHTGSIKCEGTHSLREVLFFPLE